MSKRVSLTDATARKKDEFVTAGPPLAAPRGSSWEEEERDDVVRPARVNDFETVPVGV